MAELFKNLYNESFFELFSSTLSQAVNNFNKTAFLNDVYSDNWEEKELKQRTRHIALVLRNHLHEDFAKSTQQILKIITLLRDEKDHQWSIEFLFLPDYIEVFGLDDYDTSIPTLEEITQFITCEFAVRPFILKYPDAMLKQMESWSKHKDYRVRRLASEGYRPRLPWGMALPFLKKDPTPLFNMFDRLKDDSSETVRRSVANNLNDVSKDNPDVVIQLAKQWKGISPEVDWVVKHACRTLLKQGTSEVMELFGFGSVKSIAVNKLTVLTPQVAIGDHLNFSFDLENTSNKEALIRLEYGLYYLKANGTLSRKVFKISEKNYAANSVTTIDRKQSFKVITTRKFYTGGHRVSVIVNGKEFDVRDFELV